MTNRHRFFDEFDYYLIVNREEEDIFSEDLI
jgi:hypothetical protein